MHESPDTSLAYFAAQEVRRGFDEFHRRFRAISRRAERRFSRADWSGARRDALERLDLYGRSLGRLVRRLERRLGAHARDPALWTAIHDRFASLLAGRHDAELAETFFNSTTRRLFAHDGVMPGIEFLDYRKPPLPPESGRAPIFRRYVRVAGSDTLIGEILADLPFARLWADLPGDARLAGALLDRRLAELGLTDAPLTAEVLVSLFYRNKGAYVIGRLRAPGRVIPLLLALVHTEHGVEVDAVLTRTDETSIVFSFTRSYFHVDIEHHREVIAFLRSIMPDKPVAELYTALGYHKHGKTLLWRDLQRHLARSDERFVFARGTRGLVMEVFTLPGYDVVFKVVRDRFPWPKRTTRQRVHAAYELVHRHDRVGRLVDAQQFEHLSFARDRFDEALLDALLATSGRTVRLDGDRVIIAHVYTERRVTPLDVFIREAAPDAAREAIIDYGFAVRDLAAADIFPGDLLLKNFGVTRHLRAVFYDYDEIQPLGAVNFREFPEARTPEDELSDEPWFPVAENDVFPEEFGRFLGMPRELREEFVRWHGELLTARWWQEMQQRTRAGELVDVIPYREDSRLHPRRGR